MRVKFSWWNLLHARVYVCTLLDLQFYMFVYDMKWNKVNRIECNFVQICNILIGIIYMTIIMYVYFHKSGKQKKHALTVGFFHGER